MAISSGVGPHFAIAVVNGVQFPIEKGSTHRTATKKSGTFSATIPLYYPGARSLVTIGDNQTSIIVSTRGQVATLLSGEIDDVEPDYINGTLEISGRDGSAKLHDQKTAEKWVNKQPGDIIQDLASRVGLGVNISQPLQLKMQRLMKDDYTKITDNISYGMTIHKICELMQAHWFIKDGTLNIVSGQASGGGYSINLTVGPDNEISCDALSLKIKRNVQAGKPINVTVKSWHTRDAKTYQGQNQVGGNGTTKNYVYHLPNLTQDHVDQHAKAKSKDHNRHEITVTAECVGDPSIDISQGLTLSGTDLDGTYTIDGIEDSFGMDGHTMTINAKGPLGGAS